MKKFLLIAFAFSLVMTTQCRAVNWEWPVDPVKAELVGADDDGEASFRAAMKGENSCGGRYDAKLCNQYKEKMAEAIAKGNIKARLIRGTNEDIAAWKLKRNCDGNSMRGQELCNQYREMVRGPEGDILNAFQTVDQSNDSKLIYEVGALMWLGNHLACLNVIEENGVTRVERYCHNEKNTISFEEKRKERSFGYILKAAKMGYPPAQYAIGFILQTRYTRADVTQVGYVPTNVMEQVGISGMQPLDWIKKAAEAGSAEAVLLLSNIQKEEQEKADKEAKIAAEIKAHEAIKPKCDKVRFSGVATPTQGGWIEKVLASKDIEDTLARNPILCSFNSGGGDMYANSKGGIISTGMTCRGFGYFRKQRGEIFNWDKEYFTVVTDVDFPTGRKSILLNVRRKDATCIK